MSARKKYPKWTRIPWDGNPALGLECWRKTFGSGHVSVGIGDFLTVVFSFGADSDSSYSGTRWNYDKEPLSEEEVMQHLDEVWELRERQPGCWKFGIQTSMYTGKPLY